jgi:hypothetical protein
MAKNGDSASSWSSEEQRIATVADLHMAIGLDVKRITSAS